MYCVMFSVLQKPTIGRKKNRGGTLHKKVNWLGNSEQSISLAEKPTHLVE